MIIHIVEAKDEVTHGVSVLCTIQKDMDILPGGRGEFVNTLLLHSHPLTRYNALRLDVLECACRNAAGASHESDDCGLQMVLYRVHAYGRANNQVQM